MDPDQTENIFSENYVSNTDVWFFTELTFCSTIFIIICFFLYIRSSDEYFSWYLNENI